MLGAVHVSALAFCLHEADFTIAFPALSLVFLYFGCLFLRLLFGLFFLHLYFSLLYWLCFHGRCQWLLGFLLRLDLGLFTLLL